MLLWSISKFPFVPWAPSTLDSGKYFAQFLTVKEYVFYLHSVRYLRIPCCNIEACFYEAKNVHLVVWHHE